MPSNVSLAIQLMFGMKLTRNSVVYWQHRFTTTIANPASTCIMVILIRD